MKYLRKYIDGLDNLMDKLPEDYHFWHRFGHNILELKFSKEFDYEEEFDYLNNIEMILADCNEKYKIRMKLKNVYGLMSFDIMNGFFSGFQIEYLENNDKFCRYRLSSFEQDIYFEVYCQKISVQLIEE